MTDYERSDRLLLAGLPEQPELIGVLYERHAPAGLPGVHLTGKVTDGLGRAGTGVERGGETLVIDPADGRLLADNEGEGWSATFVSQGPVDSAPAASASQGPTKGAPEAPASQAPAGRDTSASPSQAAADGAPVAVS